jgi:hypothetical protein
VSVQKWLETIRRWVDEEELPAEEGKTQPRSKWEDFLVAIAREVEKTMQNEMFTPPGGPTYIPREYIVFLSRDDDSEWQGEKRDGLERGLHYVLSERARELVGEKQFQTKSFTVELRVDPALEKDRFRVQHVWDADAQKTVVRPRKERSEPATTTSAAPDDEATVVRPRKPSEPSFVVSVTSKAATSAAGTSGVRRFYKDEITIGRGSKQVEVDLKLEGDLEVSRKHATLTKAVDGVFTVTCHGANPILVDGREIAGGQTAEVKPGSTIEICSHQLVVEEPEHQRREIATTAINATDATSMASEIQHTLIE